MRMYVAGVHLVWVAAALVLTLSSAFGQPDGSGVVAKKDADSATLQRLKDLAKKHNIGALCLQIGDEQYVITVPGSQSVDLMRLDDPELFSRLLRSGALDRPGVREQIIEFASELNQQGIQQRVAGNLEGAAQSYRFALFATTYYQVPPGMAAISGSYRFLLQALRSEIEQSLLLKGRPRKGSPIRLLGGNVVMAAQNAPDIETVPLVQRMRNDGKKLLALMDKTARPDEPEQLLDFKLARLRIAALAGQDEVRRQALSELILQAKAQGREELALETVLDDLAEVDFFACVAITSEDNDPSLREAAEAFLKLWAHYLNLRSAVPKSSNPMRLLANYRLALSHLEFLRSHAVSAGGAFGHRFSYEVSSLIQPVGRDAAFLLMSNGKEREALALSERLHARALGDWMARAHPTGRLAMPPLGGSAGELVPADEQEIADAAKTAGAPLLIYLQDRWGYSVWLQQPDGTVRTARIPDPGPLLDRVLERLPHLANIGELGKLVADPTRAAEIVGQAPVAGNLGNDLQRLYEVILPAKIRAGLPTNGDKLVIIPDGPLLYLPFCALRNTKGRYLVEDAQLSYWPSVTTWLVIEDTSVEVAARRPTPPQVMGISDFKVSKVPFRGQAREVHLGPLPGAAREAAAVATQLGTTALLGERAKLNTILTREKWQWIPIVHLATHGVVDPTDADSSFLVFAEQVLTARALYDRDGIINVGLVMMSACQTALGGHHPDSTIGLANGFLIAGARTVGSTLWQISDRASELLMVRFYKEIQGGAGPATALRTAQLAMLHQERWAHPYYWAAFKLTGSDRSPLLGPAPDKAGNPAQSPQPLHR